MKKEVALLIFIILIGIFFITFSSSKISLPDKVDKAVVDELKTNERVNVMVEFNKKEQYRIRDLKGRIKGKIKREFNYSETIYAELTESEIADISRYTAVKRIRKEKQFSVSLSTSVPLINATLTWPLTYRGINLTGINQTVCVIDTGVDYTHPDLGGCFGENNFSSPCKVFGGYDFYNNDNNPMDDNSHGTHVAGIVAANGGIRGVAPDARIAALKALSSSGSCSEVQIIDAMEWCIENASKYNIKVISMSLGDNLNYTSYCDGDYYPITGYVYAAYDKNISVVIAAGNNGDYTGISGPACISKTIPVGATTKGDAIATYSQRNQLVQLLAPGSNIVSTVLTGASGTKDGTSMATPHVAGALAIMYEFLELTGNTKNPHEMEQILNLTGKKITDSMTGLNYSRINVKNAIDMLDVNNTQVNLIYPTGASKLFNQSFLCNASSTKQITNVSFFIWNQTSIVNSSFSLLSGLNNQSQFNYTFEQEDIYLWNCLFSTINESAFAENNNSFNIDLTSPNVNLILPVNENSTTGPVIFIFSIEDLSSISNCSLIIENNLNVANNSISNVTFNQSITGSLSTGSHSWSINCTDIAGNEGNSSSRSITIQSQVINQNSIIEDGGGGGGGGGTLSLASKLNNYYLVFDSSSRIYEYNLNRKDVIHFTIYPSGENHTLTLIDVINNKASIEIKSSPILLSLGIGETARLNFSSKDYYDTEIKAIEIKNDNVTIIISKIWEKIVLANEGNAQEDNPSVEQEENKTGEPAKEFKIMGEDKIFGFDRWLAYTLMFIFIALVIVSFTLFNAIRSRHIKTRKKKISKRRKTNKG